MKAKELAKLLRQSPDAEVYAWDADGERFQPVTGILLAPETTFTDGRVTIQTDIEP